MGLSVFAIVISIVLGITSNVLTPSVTRFLNTISAAMRARNEQRKLVLERTVEYLLDHPREVTNLWIRYWGRAALTWIVMAMSIIMMFSSNNFETILGFFFFIIGNYGSTKADRLGKLIDRVSKQKRADHPGIDLDWS